tara:strand:+ start:539083 stop:540018 length:936 start_codon:yes stop_codon:yes gene_type:complete
MSMAIGDDTNSSGLDDAEVQAPTRLQFDSPQVQRYRIGLILETPVTCVNALATFPVPISWPEQEVRVIGQEIDPLVTKWGPRDLVPRAKQLVVEMNRVPAGAKVEVTFEVEVKRSRILPPEQTDDLVIPKRLPREISKLYMGNSPFIDASSSIVRKASREVAKQDAEDAWHRVEQIYDYVRDNVEYVEGNLKNASDALKDGKGDCEEMTSLFVAMCRNNRIPARVVWIPDHCYPEFYLEDAEGNGFWFPCQAAGTRQFGRMDEYRPVLQKGDRFKLPEKPRQVRYVSEFFSCLPQGKGTPRPQFIRDRIDL